MRRLLVCLMLAAAAPAALAFDFRSVGQTTVIYDSPSTAGKKLFIAPAGMPFEVLVQVDNWTKIREADGIVGWIPKATVSATRTLIVIADRAPVRKQPSLDAPLVFEAQKGVGLQWVEAPLAGWVRVRHADGQAGYARIEDLWGL
jgi:SH3-like domain-containing protein